MFFNTEPLADEIDIDNNKVVGGWIDGIYCTPWDTKDSADATGKFTKATCLKHARSGRIAWKKF